jgi:hypothetical protein
LVERLVIEFSLSELHGIEMMDHDSFIAHQMYARAQSPEAAEKKWLETAADADTFKTTANGFTYVAVKMNVKYEMKKSITKQAIIEHGVTDLRTDSDKSNGLKRALGALASSSSNGVFDQVNGHAFLTGVKDGLSEHSANKHSRKRDALEDEVIGHGQHGSSELASPAQKVGEDNFVGICYVCYGVIKNYN